MDKKEKKQMSFYKKCSLFTLIIAIATLMMSIGYASINSITLDIVGSLTAKENIQTGIYVSDYVLASANGTNDKSQKIKKYYGTLINGGIVLDGDSSSVTYTVKVFNNSEDAVITNAWGSGITVNLENGILSFIKASSEWGEPFPAGGTQSWVGSFTFTSSLSPSDFYPFEYSSEVTYK